VNSCPIFKGIGYGFQPEGDLLLPGGALGFARGFTSAVTFGTWAEIG